ncbi:MAG TPA: DUF4124 domain-containing protein [Gallionella sp.]|nr:DUF4124 domain-containing protein [Gallionella sp.]
MHNSKLIIALIAGLAFSLPVNAKMYKWVDDKGVTHVGDTIPPEYADKDRTELNKSGRAIKKDEVLNAEERRAKDQLDNQKRAADEAVLESRRHDKALLSTYSNSAEIDLARSRNMQQIDARVSGMASQVSIVNDRLLGLQKEAEGRTKAGKKIPQSLQEDLQETQERLRKLKEDHEKAKADKAAMEARYDADKARYKELTGK